VADLRLLPHDQFVELHDIWEKFRLELVVNYPGQILFVEGLTKEHQKMTPDDGVFFLKAELSSIKCK
jgi:hypothetical protein